jgi:hypothetical protein
MGVPDAFYAAALFALRSAQTEQSLALAGLPGWMNC